MSEIPQFLSHLPTYGGYPVPFTQKWFDGKPDFRVIDPDKATECIDQKLCAICGRRLGEFCWFIGGDKAKDVHLFLDPPMHEQCTEFASRTCPFVSGQRQEYSHRPVNENTVTVKAMEHSVRPTMYMMRTRTKKIGFVKVGGEQMIQAWIWSKVKEIPTKGE